MSQIESTKSSEIDLQQIERRADGVYQNTPYSPEQCRILACRERGLTIRQTANLLEKPTGTVSATWFKIRRKWERIEAVPDEIDEVFNGGETTRDE